MQGWVTYRRRQDRALALTSDPHTYEKPGKYRILVKVIDIFGNDTSQALRGGALSMRKSTMQLTTSEQEWLDAYREALATEHPGAVERMLVYGSKARGEAGPDSDLDVLLVVGNDYADLKRPLRRIGYLLAAATDVVPSIMAYTCGEWELRRHSGSPFRRAVEHDGVRVL